MNLLLIVGLIAALLGAGISGGLVHKIDGTALAREQASHQADLAKINAASAKALSDALAKQQVAEGKVSDIETQYNTEVSNHAKDSLDYRAQLIAGTQRVRVRVASCVPAATSSQGATAAGSANDSAAYADLDPTVASGVVQVAADDQAEIDKLAALQAYVKALQDQGFISKPL